MFSSAIYMLNKFIKTINPFSDVKPFIFQDLQYNNAFYTCTSVYLTCSYIGHAGMAYILEKVWQNKS